MNISDLNRDWIHSDRQVASFHMSEAQWASFISSQGGGGTPITFESRPIDSAELQLCPGIESIETMRETFHRELNEKCQHYMAQAIELAEALSLAAADGKAGKGRLVELQKMASERTDEHSQFILSELQLWAESIVPVEDD